MAIPRVLAMVMAGGEGTRLNPLTAERSKPAVPFGGRYRIVDFVLSNLVNSEIHSIYLLVQYKSQSLIEHVRRAWSVSNIIADHFVTCLLYTSDAADDLTRVDLGGRRIIKKKKNKL